MVKTQALMQKIQALPLDRLGEVEKFVDTLTAQSRRLAALDRLMAFVPAAETNGILPMTEAEIQDVINGVRAATKRPREREKVRKDFFF